MSSRDAASRVLKLTDANYNHLSILLRQVDECWLSGRLVELECLWNFHESQMIGRGVARRHLRRGGVLTPNEQRGMRTELYRIGAGASIGFGVRDMCYGVARRRRAFKRS